MEKGGDEWGEAGALGGAVVCGEVRVAVVERGEDVGEFSLDDLLAEQDVE